MIKDLYSFVGCSCALEYYINASSSSDKQTALDASAELVTVRESIMQQSSGDSSFEKAREVFGQNAVTVIESIEKLRGASLYAELDNTLVDLLDHFYVIASSLLGGGGGGVTGWPSSGSGSNSSSSSSANPSNNSSSSSSSSSFW